MKLGCLAIGFPLPGGGWSTGEKPFAIGDTITIIFASKGGAKVYGQAVAVVGTSQSSGGECYVARFTPIA